MVGSVVVCRYTSLFSKFLSSYTVGSISMTFHMQPPGRERTKLRLNRLCPKSVMAIRADNYVYAKEKLALDPLL